MGITSRYLKADGRTVRALILSETRKRGPKVLSKKELEELKTIAKKRGIKIQRKTQNKYRLF